MRRPTKQYVSDLPEVRLAFDEKTFCSMKVDISDEDNAAFDRCRPELAKLAAQKEAGTLSDRSPLIDHPAPVAPIRNIKHASRWSASALSWSTAALLCIGLLLISLIKPDEALAAQEFLTRAAEAQNPASARPIHNTRRIAHQRVKIRTGKATVIREYKWQLEAPLGDVRWNLKQSPAEWTAPLSAEGFMDWRSRLSYKRDDIRKSDTLISLETTAEENAIRQARLTVRASDFHPVAQYLRFADHRELELTEISFDVAEEGSVPTRDRDSIQPDPSKTPPEVTTSVNTATEADLAALEMRLRAEFFRLGWDVAEDLNVERMAGEVILRGTASAAERVIEIRKAVASYPRVRVEVTSPEEAAQPSGPTVHIRPDMPHQQSLLDEKLVSTFRSAGERREFVNRMVTASDRVVDHAHALNRIANRYNKEEIRLLSNEGKQILLNILNGHLDGLQGAHAELDEVEELLSADKGVISRLPGDWYDAASALVKEAQHQDRLLNTLLINGNTDVPARDIETALGEARQEIPNLLRYLRKAMSKVLDGPPIGGQP